MLGNANDIEPRSRVMCSELFGALDKVEDILGNSKFLTGDQVTEADVRLFMVRQPLRVWTHAFLVSCPVPGSALSALLACSKCAEQTAGCQTFCALVLAHGWVCGLVSDARGGGGFTIESTGPDLETLNELAQTLIRFDHVYVSYFKTSES